MNGEDIVFIILAVVAAAAIVALWVWSGRKRAAKLREYHAAQQPTPQPSPGPAAADPQTATSTTTADPAPASQEDEDPDAWLADHHRVRWDGDPADFQPTSDTWALAVAAPYALCQGGRWNRARNDDPNQAREMLAQAWGVRDRTSLLHAMLSLLITGHRTTFAKDIATWSAMTEEESAAAQQNLAPAAAQFDDYAERLWQLRRVRANDRGIRDIDLTAYDLVRFAMLAREGATAEFLSDAEAVDFIRMIEPDLRPRYASWSDLGTAFHTTRWFWNSEGGEGERSLLAHDASRAEALIDPADGPWALVPWAQPVEPSRMLFVDALLDIHAVDVLSHHERAQADEDVATNGWMLRIDDELLRRGLRPA